MRAGNDVITDEMGGDVLLMVLSALANPQRLRIMAELATGRRYVSDLARKVRLSRPLVHAHLARLSAAGLVSSALELSADGKATRYVEVSPFVLHLTPDRVAQAVRTLEVPCRRGSQAKEDTE